MVNCIRSLVLYSILRIEFDFPRAVNNVVEGAQKELKFSVIIITRIWIIHEKHLQKLSSLIRFRAESI